ncbi:DUF6879 family protein [Streptomyces odonnellii]|uniref:DUF6879 family protein n=1 Tax=Streptomyces odonnellii TaxID=1417980 RepID=UPI000625D01C|nr:DUF6879 family protein [Streptomyces odonnellii]
MPSNVPGFTELLSAAKHSAVHLEMRDVYYSNPRFEAWQRGERIDWSDRSRWWSSFHDEIADAVARGVHVRRARVVSEPVTQYIAWEHYITKANVAAGENVRWLPRRNTTDLLLPGNDFWIFDERVIRAHHFAGNGDIVEHRIHDDPTTVEMCASAFERIWERAIPHDEYEIR